MKKQILIASVTGLALTATAGTLAIDPVIIGKDGIGYWPIQALLCALIALLVWINNRQSSMAVGTLARLIEHSTESIDRHGARVDKLSAATQVMSGAIESMAKAIEDMAATCERCKVGNNEPKGGAE